MRSIVTRAAVGLCAVLAACSNDSSAPDQDALLDRDVALVTADAAARDIELMRGPGGPMGFGLPAAPGRFECATAERGPMTIARTCTFRDATGAVQDAYDSVTTESVTVHAEMSGDLGREDWSASVSGVRDFVATGLAGAETSITWNGMGTETMTRVRELADGEEHRFDMSGTETVTDVVIPVPRRPAGWPLSGTIARHVTVTLTGGPRDGQPHERDVTITFDGTQFATVTVNGESFTMDLARRQHAGRPHRGPGHGPGPGF
jgi:hypothetical protein